MTRPEAVPRDIPREPEAAPLSLSLLEAELVLRALHVAAERCLCSRTRDRRRAARRADAFLALRARLLDGVARQEVREA